MENTELRTLLEKIHLELQQIQNVDEKDQEILRDLSADIQELLQRSPHLPVRPANTTLGRIESVIEQMEVEHPMLTASLSQFLAVLSNAGI